MPIAQEQRFYAKKSTQAVAEFISDLGEHRKDNHIFDSVAATESVTSAINGAGSVPPEVQALQDRMGGDFKYAMTALLDGISSYESNHGVQVPADVVQQAMHSASIIFDHAASNTEAYNGALGQMAPITTITSAINEAIPFATYAPVNNKSEAILGVINHRAQSDLGGYSKGDSVDGDGAGRPYVCSQRAHSVTADGSGDPVSFKLTRVQTDFDTADQAATGVPLVRGSCKVYINGMRAAVDPADGVDADSPLNSTGSISIGGTKYAVSGTVTLASGVFSVLVTPALPLGVVITGEASIDFNADESLIPMIGISYISKTIKASRNSGAVQSNFESNIQFNAELALDPLTESLIALQTQFGIERHRVALAKMRRIGKSFMATVDLDFPDRSDTMNFADAWRDASSQIVTANMNMVSRTDGTSMGVGYTGKHLASHLLSLDREDFMPSGIGHRTGIYRVGRLVKHGIDVYLDPSISDSVSASQMLCVGRNSEVARNPVVVGDYAGPQLSGPIVRVGGNTTMGYHSLDITEVNPLGSFAQAVSVLNFINMGSVATI